MKLKCDELLSSFAFKFNLRRYHKQRELKKEIEYNQKNDKPQSTATIMATNDRKQITKHVKTFAFKTLDKDLTDDKRLKYIAAGPGRYRSPRRKICQSHYTVLPPVLDVDSRRMIFTLLAAP